MTNLLQFSQTSLWKVKNLFIVPISTVLSELYTWQGKGILLLAGVDKTLNLCTRFLLRLGGPRQHGMQSFPNTFTHNYTGNRTCDLYILGPTLFSLRHVLPLYLQWTYKLLSARNLLIPLLIVSWILSFILYGHLVEVDALTSFIINKSC